MKVALVLTGIAAVLLILVWAGLQIKPAPYAKFAPQAPQSFEQVALPAGLPAPVERFYRQVYGETVPLIQSAVVQGRGSMRFFGLPVPIRFRFAHQTGQDFRHDIELTFFGLPFIKGFETYIDGHGWANTPGMNEGAGFDQGSNVSLWAETLNWFPAVLVTDPRVAWNAVDADTALLSVPYGAGREVFVVRFDPERGTVQYIEAMKFKAAIGKKMLWNNGVWFDEGQPWIRLDVEDTQLNVPVRDYIRAERP